MSVKGVIFDVSGTMLVRGQAVAGIVEAVDRLRKLGVRVIAANSNGPAARATAELVRAGIKVDYVVTRNEVGIAKGSPRWIEHIKSLTGLQTNELLYVGDSELDMVTASHGKVVYFHASWSVHDNKYGLPAPAPTWIAAVVEHIFRKQHPWGWSIAYQAQGGRLIRQLALADVNVLKRAGIQYDLVEMLKDRQEPQVGQMSLRMFIVLHLTASIYAAGLQDTTDIWTVMPSHNGQRVSQMSQSLDLVAKLFRDRYEGDLIQRHTPALHSKEAFDRGGILGAITNQVDTLLVNPALLAKIPGKTALIIDDFLTRGISTGIGRAFLRIGGAADVVTVAIGKFGPKTTLCGRPSDPVWDVTQPAPTGSAETIPHHETTGDFHQEALDEFLASYKAMRGERW